MYIACTEHDYAIGLDSTKPVMSMLDNRFTLWHYGWFGSLWFCFDDACHSTLYQIYYSLKTIVCDFSWTGTCIEQRDARYIVTVYHASRISPAFISVVLLFLEAFSWLGDWLLSFKSQQEWNLKLCTCNPLHYNYRLVIADDTHIRIHAQPWQRKETFV